MYKDVCLEGQILKDHNIEMNFDYNLSIWEMFLSISVLTWTPGMEFSINMGTTAFGLM